MELSKRYLVKVKQNHIDNAKHSTVDKNPIGLALLDSLPGATTVAVGINQLIVFADGFKIKHKLPPRSVVRAIRQFDKGKAVKPFNFYFVPSSSLVTSVIFEGIDYHF